MGFSVKVAWIIGYLYEKKKRKRRKWGPLTNNFRQNSKDSEDNMTLNRERFLKQDTKAPTLKKKIDKVMTLKCKTSSY